VYSNSRPSAAHIRHCIISASHFSLQQYWTNSQIKLEPFQTIRHADSNRQQPYLIQRNVRWTTWRGRAVNCEADGSTARCQCCSAPPCSSSHQTSWTHPQLLLTRSITLGQALPALPMVLVVCDASRSLATYKK